MDQYLNSPILPVETSASCSYEVHPSTFILLELKTIKTCLLKGKTYQKKSKHFDMVPLITCKLCKQNAFFCKKLPFRPNTFAFLR